FVVSGRRGRRNAPESLAPSSLSAPKEIRSSSMPVNPKSVTRRRKFISFPNPANDREQPAGLPRRVSARSAKRKRRWLPCGTAGTAQPQPNLAKRLECVQLAGAFGPPSVLESGSKLHALQTLRAIHTAARTRASYRFSSRPEALPNDLPLQDRP